MAKKILIVEDNIVILTMQKQIFEMEGYEIVTAQEGMDALKKIHQEHPDVVLLDVNIPGMNGFELCRQIKEDPGLQSDAQVLREANVQVGQPLRLIEIVEGAHLALVVGAAANLSGQPRESWP